MMFYPPAMTARKQRKGFGLIEAAIVLGVVGLVIGGIWAAAAAVRENHRVEQAVSGVLVISSNVRTTFNGNWPTSNQLIDLTYDNGTYKTLGQNLDIIKGASGFSYRSGGGVYDPWGNPAFDIEIHPQAYGQPDTFIIWFKRSSTSQCIKLISAITSKFNDNSNLTGILIGNFPYSVYTSFPMLPTAAQCNYTWFGFAFSH